MAESTEIAWTDSTFNPWWGCTRVGPGCENCYAAALDHRIGGNNWGADKEYRTMKEGNWKNPRKWERSSQKFYVKNGRRRRVFCASMADIFDKKGPETERRRLWEEIRATPSLDWQILTKRPGNIIKYLPSDWGEGYSNVWLGATVENRKHGLPRIDQLRSIPAAIRFLSIEPLLEDLGDIDLSGIDWVIVGGESGTNARPMKKEWMIKIRSQCLDAHVPFFFKQWGAVVGKGGCKVKGIEIKEWPQPKR